MTSAKRVIVNADELGRSPGVNRGILDAHAKGVVSSATLLVNAAGTVDAVRLVRDAPNLGVGLHLALTDGGPVAPLDQLPGLVDPTGALPAGPDGLLRAPLRDVLVEARAQLRLFRELMRREPTHLDSHQHAHRIPVALQAVVTLAWETGLPVRSTSPEMRARFQRERIPTADHFVEDFFGPRASAGELVRILGALPLGTSEVMCHPGFVDEALRRGSLYVDPRESEHAALVDGDVRQVLQASGLRLAHYGQL